MDTKGSSKKHPASYQIREFLLPVMENYKYGLLTEEAFCTTVKQYYDTNELSVHNDDDLQTLTEKMLPDLVEKLEAQSVSSGSAEADQKRKIEAWILFKDCLDLLEGRPLFSKGREEYVTTGRSWNDAVEYSDRYLLIEREMETLVRAETGEGDYLGFCHLYWEVKKRVLWEKFGIEWHSPSDRNPGVLEGQNAKVFLNKNGMIW